MNKIVTLWTSGSISTRCLLSEGATEVTECKKNASGRSPGFGKHVGHLKLVAGPLPEIAWKQLVGAPRCRSSGGFPDRQSTWLQLLGS